MKYFSLLILFLSTTWVWENFYRMKWSPGDKIGCQLDNALGDLNFKHWMLGADDSNTVIHLIGEKKDGYVGEQNKYDVPKNMFRKDKCVNRGQGLLGAQAVERAREFAGQRHRYSLTGCNCGHYVDYWADGGKLCSKDEVVEALVNFGTIIG